MSARRDHHGARALLLLLLGIGLLLSMTSTGIAQSAEKTLLFLSTQFTPLHEADAMRNEILAGFAGAVDFLPYDNEVFLDLVLGTTVEPASPDVLGTLYGDFVVLHDEGVLGPVDDVLAALGDRAFAPSLLELGRMDGVNSVFVPWTQATYLMVAHRDALVYLPEEVNLSALTYGELIEWARAIRDATGESMLGFPVGTQGLMHRFFQGYLYPSYTGGMVRGFRSEAAVAMWEDFRELWDVTTPRSLTFTRMDQALLSGEVWIAWDHTARLIGALQERPEDFMAFPAPVGPAGRGYYAVLSGLGIPADVENREGAVSLIEYLTRPSVQVLTLTTLGFFPVVDLGADVTVDAGLLALSEAVLEQSGGEDSIASLLPVGLGEYQTDFNQVYMTAFSQIVLRHRDIRTVLDEQAETLAGILQAANAPCWPPDGPSEGPCPVE